MLSRKSITYGILFPLLLFPYNSFSQQNLRAFASAIVQKNVEKKDEPKQSRTKKKIISNQRYQFSSTDTVYAYETKKQHGWFAPLGILTKEQAAHRSLVYRFTCRNAQGNWCKLETIDSYGNYREGVFSPYILKTGSADTDSTSNSVWVEKLNTSCIYEIIADPTGKTVVQERAYDKNLNIVYIYSRALVGKDENGCSQYVGSYKDNYGMPAEMRKEDRDTYTYGTLVRLTEDRWGNDSIVEYLDAKGVRKKNSDGAAMEAFVYNAKGQVVKSQSRDSLGNLVIDNWGNCGVLFTYNNDYTISSATYMDDKWQPMRMPENRASVDNHATVMQTRYKYDKYKRQTEASYFLMNGTPDVNKYGIHKRIFSYDNHGNIIRLCNYDKEGNVVNEEDNFAYYSYTYDEKGRFVEGHWYDCEGKPRVSERYLSTSKVVYDNNGNPILEERYQAIDNTEHLCYKREVTPQRIYTLWSDGTSRVDSLDANGRTTFMGFYGTDGQLEMTGGRAYERYWYRSEGKITVTKEIDYDEKGNRIDVNGICETINKVDSIAWTITKWRYNAEGELKETFVYRYSPDFENLIGQDDANSFGVVSRSGGASSVRYYKGNVMYNHKSDIVSIYGRDEFGEKDYIGGDEVLYCYSKMLPNSSTRYYDENDNEVDDYEALRDSLPKAMTIEVVDSSAYELGLRDNDVILLYGNYVTNLDSMFSYNEFRAEWTLRSVLNALDSKRMVVFRIEDASQNKYGLVEINNLVGTASELGFMAHIRYLTQKQKSRIQQAIAENLVSTSPLLTLQDLHKPYNKGGDKSIIMAYPELYREYRNYLYPKEITDPAILLGACSSNMSWTVNDITDTDNFDAILKTRKSSQSKYQTLHFFLTKDAKRLTPLVLTERYPYTNWFDTFISDDDYKKLSALYTQAKDSVESLCRKSDRIINKDFVGYWEIQPNEAQTYPVTGYLDIADNGEVDGEISYSYYKEYGSSGYYFAFKKVRIYVGRWDSYRDSWLYLPQSPDSLDYIGIFDESEVSKLSGFLNSGICSDFFINSMNKKAFITSDSIVFIKKEKPQYLKMWSEEQKDSVFDLAYKLWRTDEDIQAHHLFTQLAHTNYSKAYLPLCIDYISGFAVNKNMAEAEKWERLCRKDSIYEAAYRVARQYVNDNNGKKAKEYMGYLRQGKRLKWYNELMGKYLLQNGDTIKALPYLNDYMYYLYSKDDSAAIINYWKDYNNKYFVRYPRQAADGMAHLAYNVYDLDYYKDAIATFNKARSIKGNVKTEQIDYEKTYWELLKYMSEKSPEQYGEMFKSYITDKCFKIKWKKDNPVAKTTGIKGECILLAYNGWNITTTETPYEERRPTSDVEKERHLLLYKKGKVIKYDYTGEDSFTIEIETVSKEEKTKLVRLYEQTVSSPQKAAQ